MSGKRGKRSSAPRPKTSRRRKPRSWLDEPLRTTDLDVLRPALGLFAPRRIPPLAEWIERYAKDPEGRHWDTQLYPHMLLPGGPCEAYDDPTVTDIWLKMATRLGKTFWALVTLLYTAATTPVPMLYAMPTQQALLDKLPILYRMIEHCDPLRGQLLPEHLRTQQRIELAHCWIAIAWGGSPTKLADKEAARGVATEIDKWERSQARMRGEGDPLKLFDQRFVNRFWKKRIKESTPTVENLSRIEAGFMGADQRRLWVPCPHCRTFQKLEFYPNELGRGGLVFDRTEGGGWHKDLARRTARYLCLECGQAIPDHLRPAMVRGGVWAPEGATVQRSGQAVNLPEQPGTERSYELSSLYALVLSWGEIAAEFVKSRSNPLEMQNFVNSWLAQVWKTSRRELDEAELIARLTTEHPQGIAPPWSSFLTAGIDLQQEHLVWQVWAWGSEARGLMVDYGTVQAMSDLGPILEREYDRPGNGQLRVRVALFDSGYKPDDVHKFCQQYSRGPLVVLPSKGLVGMPDQSYRIAAIDKGQRKGRRICHVNTNYWQAVVQGVLEGRAPSEPGGMGFCATVRHDADFWSQLTNEQLSLVRAPSGAEQVRWTLVDEHRPNDFRDAWRYARCAAEAFVRGRWSQIRGPAEIATPAALAAAQDAAQDASPVAAQPPSTRQVGKIRSAKRPAAKRRLSRPGGWLQRV